MKEDINPLSTPINKGDAIGKIAVTKREVITKREIIAIAAMQGLSSALWADCTAENCAKKAVEYADALINELNK